MFQGVFNFTTHMVEMKLTEATTQEEVKAALAEIYPDRIEFEPGKFAQFDSSIADARRKRVPGDRGLSPEKRMQNPD